MPRALLSVYDKTGLIEFSKVLTSLGWELIASGGTATTLAGAGLPVTTVEQVTQHAEILGGRVKTLHPAIHGGILARDTEEDLHTLRDYGYAPISLVVVNLYPFQQTVAKPGVSQEEAIEQIDIGGVALLRASAKNFQRVITLCDPRDYPEVIDQIRTNSMVTPEVRQRLATKAFAHTRDYDAAITAYLESTFDNSSTTPIDALSDLPETLSLALHRVDTLRYGENPHQKAALYAAGQTAGPLGGTVLGGKALSYNNLLDLDSAWRTLGGFDQPTVAIVKHLTPCGVASGDSLAGAFPSALASDPVSAYGGVIAVNRPVDDAFVTALGDLFVEAIAAPGFSESAQNQLATKRKNCRLVRITDSVKPGLELRSIRNGILAQTTDAGDPPENAWRVVSQRKPNPDELTAFQFAWRVVQHVKSNAIVLATQAATIGIGGGLPSRVDAARIAIEKAGDRAHGTAMASDAFFPFADGLEVGLQAGVLGAIEPGGSIRDNEVIAAADAANAILIFTGTRHFRH